MTVRRSITFRRPSIGSESGNHDRDVSQCHDDCAFINFDC